MANNDETFVKYVLQTGMATDAQIAAARKRLNDSSSGGTSSTISEVMVREGIITTAQRETVEKKLKAQSSGIQQLDNYKLIKKLGEGGMGAVYLAEDTVGYRKVALKVLSRKYSTNPEFLGRFRREAQALGRLNHPNIVTGFNVGEDKGYQYYVMEYCEGEPLDRRLKREKQLKIYDAIEITIQVARGLQYAHEHNTIHRDIKPGNLVATTEGLIKILDMGLSKTIGEADSSFNTQAGVTVGTPHYISPEQARGDASIDGRTDIYSLGATLYHLITGRTPFEGPTSVVIMTKHLNDQLANPADLRPDCPEGLIEVITRMMAKKADDRYLNCAELVEDLEQVAAGKDPSSPALDPVHSSIGMRSLAVGTGNYKPVAKDPANKRATGKRDPVSPDRPEREGRSTGKRDPVGSDRPEREGRSTGKRDPVSGNENSRASVRKSGPRPAASEPEPVVADVSFEPSSRSKRVSSKDSPRTPKPDAESAAPAAPAAPVENPSRAERAEAPSVPASESADAAPAVKSPSAPGLNFKIIGIAAGVAIVLGAAVIFLAFGGKKNSDTATGPTLTNTTTSPVVDTHVPVQPVPPIAVNPVTPPPVTPVAPVTPVTHPVSPPTVQTALNSAYDQVESFIQQRNYPRAKQLLDDLERNVAEKDTYNVAWCPKLDGLDRTIQNGEQTLKQEFRKQLIAPQELGAMPAGGLLLFNSAGSDARIKWSPRTIKFFTGKLPWVDGQGDSKTMSFDAPDNLLSPGPNGKIVFEYNATVECEAVIKFLGSDDKWKELPVTLPPGRLKKVEIAPGGKFVSGLSVKSMSIEFTNTRDDVLAMYRIYVTRQ